MTTAKPRRFDLSPDNAIAGCAAQMDLEEFAVYWMVILLIYSRGGPIKDDPKWIAGLFRGVNPRTIRAALDRLESMSKVERINAELMVNRCRIELELSANRVRNATEAALNRWRTAPELPVNGHRFPGKSNG